MRDAPAPPPRQSTEQMLRRARVTSFTEELDLSFASDLTPEALQVLCECMPNLKRLTLHGARLRALPDGVCRLRELRELNASNNELALLPTTLVSLTNLQHLNLAANALTELPPTIGAMPSLRLLNANNNRLARLPDSFGQLTQLRVLRLGANLLEQLPASFSNLSGLRLLQLGHNALGQIPNVLLKLERLSVLDLSYNRLTIVPESLRQMTTLATLNLTGNPLKQMPPALTLPQDLKITGVFSLLGDSLEPVSATKASKASLDNERTQPDIGQRTPSAPRPDFNGPQGQLDVTGIFLAGLLPGNNDADDAGPRNKKS